MPPVTIYQRYSSQRRNMPRLLQHLQSFFHYFPFLALDICIVVDILTCSLILMPIMIREGLWFILNLIIPGSVRSTIPKRVRRRRKNRSRLLLRGMRYSSKLFTEIITIFVLIIKLLSLFNSTLTITENFTRRDSSTMSHLISPMPKRLSSSWMLVR